MTSAPRVTADPGGGAGRILVLRSAPPPIGLTLRPTHRSYDRVDRVEWHARSGQVRVVTGTPGAPAPPSLDGWEAVAFIHRPRGAVLVTADQIVPVPRPPVAEVYRVGRKVGRTMYVQVGPEPSDDDLLIGMLDTPELARFAVDSMNAAVAARGAEGGPE